MNKISPFEAKHGGGFSRQSLLLRKKVKCSAIDKVGSLVNSEWLYSMHWDRSAPISKLKSRILDDISTEMQIAKQRVNELEEAIKIINSISDE